MLFLRHVDGAVSIKIAVTTFNETVEDLRSILVVLNHSVFLSENFLELCNAFGIFFSLPLPQLSGSVLVKYLGSAVVVEAELDSVDLCGAQRRYI